MGNYSTRFLKATGGIGEALHVMERGGCGFGEGQSEGSEERSETLSDGQRVSFHNLDGLENRALIVECDAI